MTSTLTIEVGIVVARERIDSPWQDHQWRPVEAVMPPPRAAAWTLLRDAEGCAYFHAGPAEIELHRKEAANYLDNLCNGAPMVYVVLRQTPQAPWPVELTMATASPTEIQAYGQDGDEIVGPVPMPPELILILEAFVAEHHAEEPFVKRKRKAFAQPEQHKFGQEPLVELRERMRQARGSRSDEQV